MANITNELKEYLATATRVRLAHLVAIELPGDTGAFAYYTEYFRDITYNSNNYIAGRLTSIGDVRQTKDLSAYTVSIKITGALQDELDKAVDSQSYINRKISIHRVYLDDEGNHIPYYTNGDTLLYFEGSISEVSVDENSSAVSRGSSTITWKCANEFYELEKINGRLTDDASHRGLIVDDLGNEVASASAKKLEYIDDLGFFHSNKSINILAEYQTREKAFKVEKKSSGLFGWKKSYDMVEYWRTVTQQVDMRFNLAAKYLPVIYGVQKVDGIPVFADTLVDNPNIVYVVYAFCEGEIDGFLDFYLDDKPIVCLDSTDAGDRACVGIKKYLGNTISIATPSQNPSSPSVHGQEYILNDGDGQVNFWTYHGKNNQTASSTLVNLAANNKFYLQNYGEVQQGAAYWDSRFKLLDTAYVVVKYNITANRTSIPTLSAEVQGKKVAVYGDTGLISDSSTSTNFAWQYLDYLTSPIYGAGISLDRVDLASFIEVANLMDQIDNSYSAGWLPYWRYIGWTNAAEANKKILQGNPLIDTSATVFKNIDGLITQGVCSLNIVEGKYLLTVESEKEPLAHIDYGDIVGGKIRVSDITSKEKYNSIQASILDPGLGWKKNDITFYNLDFKLEDAGVDKKLNLSFPYITNYYTARSLAERELRKSRFNREVTITLPYKYTDLRVNYPITISYDRFNWDTKPFLIKEVIWKANGKVEVVAREYTDSIFINSPKVDKSDEQVPTIASKVKPPRDVNYLPATLGNEPEGVNGTIRWLPSLTPDVTYYALRISGVVGTITIPVEGAQDPNTYITYTIEGFTEGTYTFEVRAVVGAKGYVSSPITLVVDIDPAVNLTKVTGFDLTNNAPGDESTWLGSDISVSWDPLVEEEYILGLGYELEILDSSNDVVHSYEIHNQYTLTYTYQANKLDYLENQGSPGMYRELTFRIRGIGPNGEQSVDWTYL